MHIISDAGHVIDADMSLSIVDGQPCIIIESSGGASATRPRRNPEYNLLVTTVLQRLAKHGVDLTGIYLESAKVASLSAADRLLSMSESYPISLQQVDTEELRKRIGRGIAEMHQAAGTNSSGNAQKRIRFSLSRAIAVAELDPPTVDLSADAPDELSVPSLTETERTYMRAARIGQGAFREKLLARYGSRCPLTGIKSPDLLIASHIKPWSACSTAERLDIENGILLSSLADRLFDQGLLTFDHGGGVVLSSTLAASDCAILSQHLSPSIDLTAGNCRYLEYHRCIVFEGTVTHHVDA